MQKKTEGARLLNFKKEIYREAVEYFKRYPDEFTEDVMGIKLNLYQKVLMRAFFRFSFNCWVLCRGTGKTWLGVLCLVVYCLLNPNTKAGIVAPAFRQGKLSIQEKYKDELCRLSPFLEQEEQNYVCSTQKARIEWFNGSWIEAFPIGTDGSKIRGARLHVILIDETAYVPKFIIETVVKPMMIVKRGYVVGKSQDDYEGNKLLLTSTANYRFNHLYALFVDYVKRMTEPDNTKYFAMTLPYTVGVRCGLFDEEIVKQQRSVMSEMEFEMEYLGRFPRLVKNAWVDYEDIQECSDLKHIETSGYDEFEYIMSVDVARVEGKDNTVIYVFKLHWFVDHCEADLVYLRSLNGMPFSEQADNVREVLRKFPNVIRIFQDTMTIGQGLSDELAKDYYCVDNEKWYPPLIDINDKTAMDKIEQTKGIPIIYGIKATQEINHRMGYAIKNYTEKKWIHLYPFNIEEERDLELEERQLVMESEATRMELMNIEPKGVSNGWMAFKTKSKRKDRWSALGMGLYGLLQIAKEREEDKSNQSALMLVSRR